MVGFILVRWVDFASPLGLSGSFGFVGFMRARPGCPFGRTEWVVGRPGGRSVHWSAPLGTFVSAIVVIVYIQARHALRLLHSVSLESYGRANWVVGFIRVHWVH